MGYYETDNYTMPSPAMRRAVVETKQSLEAAGHTVWHLLFFRRVFHGQSLLGPFILCYLVSWAENFGYVRSVERWLRWGEYWREELVEDV